VPTRGAGGGGRGGGGGSGGEFGALDAPKDCGESSAFCTLQTCSAGASMFLISARE